MKPSKKRAAKRPSNPIVTKLLNLKYRINDAYRNGGSSFKNIGDKKWVMNLISDVRDNNLTKLETVPPLVSHDTDFTCNLSCPSCRTNLNFNNSKTHQEEVKHELTTIVEKFPKLALLNLSGSGDPFASFGARDWLLNFDPDKYPHLKFDIRTNGTMLTPRLWNRLSNIHNSINELRISTDAATEKTYNKF